MNVGSLFAGIGGFDLGFERAGMRTLWQVEQDAYCRAVLAQHFPEAERFEDVREVGSRNLQPVDLICGGFPCQDISLAGAGGGITASRSGLWAEFARIIGELGPRWVVVENVPSLRSRGLDRVLRDLAACGYDAEWDCLPASAFGASHRRDRIWIVAYPRGGVADAARHPAAGSETESGTERQRARPGGQPTSSQNVADSEGEPERPGLCADEAAAQRGRRSGDGGGEVGAWPPEPGVGRVADGVPSRMDRLSALGNALVPVTAEWIGRRILAFEKNDIG